MVSSSLTPVFLELLRSELIETMGAADPESAQRDDPTKQNDTANDLRDSVPKSYHTQRSTHNKHADTTRQPLPTVGALPFDLFAIPVLSGEPLFRLDRVHHANAMLGIAGISRHQPRPAEL